MHRVRPGPLRQRRHPQTPKLPRNASAGAIQLLPPITLSLTFLNLFPPLCPRSCIAGAPAPEKVDARHSDASHSGNGNDDYASYCAAAQ